MKGSVLSSLELRCPKCFNGELLFDGIGQEATCKSCGERYPIISGCPVLVRNDNTLYRINEYKDEKNTAARRCRNWSRLLPGPSINLSRENAVQKVLSLLSEVREPKVLVIGSGQQRHWLDSRISAFEAIRIVYSDIDPQADVDLYCDGHNIPFAAAQFDAVVTTAVLEHVLYPEQVAGEIHRVLKIGGLLYSELPFMQQVHEGAHDFTRYTLSGHRRLLNGFYEIESGMVAGPATALVWAIESFILAFFSNPRARGMVKAMIRLMIFWLKYCDRFLANRPAAMDGASCTYFLGRKIAGQVPDADIIAHYRRATFQRND